MSSETVKIRASKLTPAMACEACRGLSLSKEAEVLLAPSLDVLGYVGVLRQAGLSVDAVLVLARSLPARQAAWWACLCVRANRQDDAQDLDMLEAAERWVIDPRVSNAEPIRDLLDKRAIETPESWCAAAINWSADGDAGAAAGSRSAVAVAAAILNSAVVMGEDVAGALADAVARGLDIAKGGTGQSTATGSKGA